MAKNKLIMLDAGHGVNTPGKRTLNGANGIIREWTLNNAVCKYIAEYLKDYNVDVQRSDDTTGNTDIPLATRVNRINAANPDLAFSIHHNALNSQWGNHGGVETYLHTNGSTQDTQLANLVQPKLVKETNLPNRGVKKASFAVLGVKSTIPIVLVEGGFMDSIIDYPFITSAAGQKAYAKAVAEAAIEYLKLTKTVTVAPNANNNTDQKVHIVQAGESLTKIAWLYQVTVQDLVEANKIGNRNLIKIGQELIIPKATTATKPATPVQKFYPATTKGGASLVDALKAINVDTSLANRKKIAEANQVKNYTGTVAQNNKLLNLLKTGKLVRP